MAKDISHSDVVCTTTEPSRDNLVPCGEDSKLHHNPTSALRGPDSAPVDIEHLRRHVITHPTLDLSHLRSTEEALSFLAEEIEVTRCLLQALLTKQRAAIDTIARATKEMEDDLEEMRASMVNNRRLTSKASEDCEWTTRRIKLLQNTLEKLRLQETDRYIPFLKEPFPLPSKSSFAPLVSSGQPADVTTIGRDWAQYSSSDAGFPASQGALHKLMHEKHLKPVHWILEVGKKRPSEDTAQSDGMTPALRLRIEKVVKDLEDVRRHTAVVLDQDLQLKETLKNVVAYWDGYQYKHWTAWERGLDKTAKLGVLVKYARSTIAEFEADLKLSGLVDPETLGLHQGHAAEREPSTQQSDTNNASNAPIASGYKAAESQSVPQNAPAHGLSMTLELRCVKPIDELTREEALNILKSLPVTATCTPYQIPPNVLPSPSEVPEDDADADQGANRKKGNKCATDEAVARRSRVRASTAKTEGSGEGSSKTYAKRSKRRSTAEEGLCGDGREASDELTTRTRERKHSANEPDVSIDLAPRTKRPRRTARQAQNTDADRKENAPTGSSHGQDHENGNIAAETTRIKASRSGLRRSARIGGGTDDAVMCNKPLSQVTRPSLTRARTRKTTQRAKRGSG